MSSATDRPGRTDPSRLVILDLIRGIAAIGVLLFHSELVFGGAGLFNRFYLFVDLFFVISGFVIDRYIAANFPDQRSTGAFLRQRLRRLWPTIAIGVCLGALLNGAELASGERLADLLLGLLIMPTLWSPPHLFPLNTPEWSLFFELVANGLHIVLLRHMGWRGLALVVALAGIGLVAITIHSATITFGGMAATWYLGLVRVMFPYCLGIALHRLWRAAPPPRTIGWEAAILLPPLSLAMLNALPLTVALGDLLAVMVILPGLVWLSLATPVPSAAAARLSWLGALSFPLYAVHMPIIWYVARTRTDHSWPVESVAIAVAFGVAWALRGVAAGTRGPRQFGARPLAA